MGFGDPPSLGVNTQLPAPSLGSLQSSALNALGLGNNTIQSQAGALPWAALPPSRFFKYVTIKPDKWDQLFPYRLIVIDAKNQNQIVGGSLSANITVTGGSDNAIVNFTPIGRQWIFQLAISPQQLNITDQFAINTTATLRGVLEEHGGLKFKMINASGTMGVWPYRQSVSSPPQSPSILQSVFGGTIAAATTLASQVSSVINTATGNSPNSKPARKGPETSAAGPTSTGYYQAMALEQFLEQYAEAKLNPKNSGWRLVFDIPKQNTSYVVTPMQYVWQQNANKPLEIMYNFQLKAWRRIDLQEKVSPTTLNVQPISPGILQRILNTISEARQTTSAAINLLGAVTSDVEAPLNVLRQTTLFVKDLAGVAITAADIPFQLQTDYQSAIADALNTLSGSIKSVVSDTSTRSSLNAVIASQNGVEGLSTAAVANGQLGTQATLNQALNPANNIFTNPTQNFTLMDQAPVHSLSLTSAQQAAIENAVDQARQTTVSQLKQYRAAIQTLALQLSNNFGTGNAFYSKIYGLPPPQTRIQPITLDEYDLLDSLYDVMQSYDILTATTQIDTANIVTNMDYVAGLAAASGIPFNNDTAKILVPVPFGLTIEGISARYLGDPQRWIEIATLNSLRDPYIDENGFQLPLLSNATGRQITVGSDEDLFIGQNVLMMSSTQTPSGRSILGIEKLSETSFLITLDGLANLGNFVLADKAYLQAYLPGTTNSQQKIYVPTDLPSPNTTPIIVPPSTSSDPLTGLSQVDWLLTDGGDVASNNYGDFRYSSGMTNLIQAVKIKIGTRKGTVLVHPEFGLGIKVGMMNSEFTAQDLYNSLTKLIEEDPRFQGLDSLQVILNGPSLNMNMAVILAGQSGVFPVNYNL
jgi:hypothetical protein